MQMSEEEIREKFRKSPVKREVARVYAKREGGGLR
jgi:hypothetical protein